MAAILYVLMLLGLVLFGGTASAQRSAQRPTTLNIASQTLTEGLNDWARQTGFQLIYPAAEVTDRLVAPSVRGTFTPRTALDLLLTGTSLTYEFVNERTVAIRERSQPHSLPSDRKITTSGGRSDLHRANAYLPENVSNPEHVRLSANVGERVRSAGGNEISEAGQVRLNDIEEVMVAGSHIRGVQNDTAPIIVIDRDQIDRAGYSTMQDLFRSLPQNSASGDTGATEDGIFGSGASRGLNPTSATGVNLRGLGESSTLVLLNGHRVAPSAFGAVVDVSMIPLVAVERVEVLPAGSSAIYGSDAVAGVVNIILRRDFQGAQTSLRYGSATDGNRTEKTVGQILGQAWSTGNAVATVQYQEQSPLAARDRTFADGLTQPNDLLPDTNGYAATLHARQDLTARLSGYSDALFSRKHIARHTSDSGFGGTVQHSRATSAGTNLASGLRYEMSSDWSLELGAEFSRQKTDKTLHRASGDLGNATATEDVRFDQSSLGLLVNGRLLGTPAGDIRLAVGGSYRDDDYRSNSLSVTGEVSDLPIRRTVKAVFGEINIPLVGEATRRTLLHDLSVSAALRYDEYSDFGSTTNPRIGIHWAPLRSVSFRASYGESFRTPSPVDLAGLNQLILFTFPFTAANGVDVVPVFLEVGTKNLRPERAQSIDFGLDYRPEAVEGLAFGLNYYRLRYEDRIVTPPFDVNALLQPEIFGPLITPLADDNAAQAFLNDELARGTQYLDFFGTGAAGVRSIVDLRQQNAAEVKQSGADLTATYTHEFEGVTLGSRFNASYIERIDTSLTSNSLATDLVDTFGKPVAWRLRFDQGLSARGWSVNAAVNYVGQYRNTAQIGVPRIDSWTTVDLVGSLDFGHFLRAGMWRGASLTLSVQNLFDRAPPFVDAPSALIVNYDPANASPLGRFVAAEFRKRW